MGNYLITKKSVELIFTDEVIVEQDNFGITIKNTNGKVILELEKVGYGYEFVRVNKFQSNQLSLQFGV